MSKYLYLLALVPALLVSGGVARAQYPIMDEIANTVIQKYQQASCEQLWQRKGQKKPPMEQEAIQKLRDNPGLRTAFINRVAAPIVNKMFECGMIP